MAPQADLTPNHRYITTHTPDGLSVFVNDISPDVPTQDIRDDVNFQLMYTTSTFPTNMNEDADLQRYKGFLQGEKPGLTIKGGTVLRAVNFGPDQQGGPAFMHRTVSIDYGIVVAGAMEALLDSGEVRRLGVGDIVVQRGTNHAWKNASKTNWARMVFVLQDSQPVEIGPKVLGEDYGGIPHVTASS